jgi:hypothetical protein
VSALINCILTWYNPSKVGFYTRAHRLMGR